MEINGAKSFPEKPVSLDPRVLFDKEFDKLIKSVDEAVDALDPLEREVWQMSILGDKVSIGGSFAPIPLSQLVTFRDPSKLIYPPAKIITVEELNTNS